jgi:hypothetical protein
MATDQSPPRLRLIIIIAIGTVVTLTSLKFVFESYFTDIMEDAAASKLVTPDEVNALHATEAKKLTTAPAIPIDQAMAQLASQGRLASTVITPQPSDDIAPITGWAHLHDVDQPAGSAGSMPASPPATTASGASSTTTPPGPPPGFDGGAMTPNTSGDAGAPKPHAPTTSTTASADAGAPH